MESTTFLFRDRNGNDFYEGDKVYYAVLSEGGQYKVRSDKATTIYSELSTWNILIRISLVKGFFKNRIDAHNNCNC